MTKCTWCDHEIEDEHKELKLCISELTHNWGLERNVFVKRIAALKKEIIDLKVQLNECKK